MFTNYRKSVRAVTTFAIGMVFSTMVFANSHTNSDNLRLQKMRIDAFITGANKGTSKLEHLPASAIGNNDCALCYHRELMKKNKTRGIDKNAQPFPGE
jgi:glucose uptake protein GlcU